MAFSYTYTTLRTALQNWVENSGSDFTDNLDTIIRLGELRLLRDLDLEIFDTSGTANTANGVSTLTKPTDMVAPRRLYYTSSGAIVTVLQRNFDMVLDYAGSGDPLYYAEKDEATWLLAPVPTSTITVTIRYIKRPNGLVDLGGSTLTSWLSLNVPDALFYACLASCEEFIKADERVALWKADYQKEILPAAKAEAHRLVRAEYRR